MKTYDITQHLTCLKIYSDFKRSKLSTFEMFEDAVERGKLKFLKEDFISPERRERLEKLGGEPLIKDYDEQYPINPPDDLLNNEPETDKFEVYFNAIYYKIERYIDYCKDLPEHFDLDDFQNIVTDLSYLNDNFIKANKQTVISYIELRETFPAFDFSSCMEQYDVYLKKDFNQLKIRDDTTNVFNETGINSEPQINLRPNPNKNTSHKMEDHSGNSEDCHLSIFKDCNSFRFFEALKDELDPDGNNKLADISYIYRKLNSQKDGSIPSHIGNSQFLLWFNEIYKSDLSRIKPLHEVSSKYRDRAYNRLYDLYKKPGVK